MTTRPHFASFYRWLVASHHLRLELRGPRILDVGCDDATFLGRSPAALRVGVDLAPRARPQNGIEIVRADARQLPLIDERFDSVLAFDVLEHIEDDRAVMREALRVLAPGGTLWFSTPARETSIWPRFVQPYANRAFGHVRNGYTPAEVRALVPAHSGWRMELFYWNEPLLRASFVPLDLLDRLAPGLAGPLTWCCYAIDNLFPAGRHGHLFGRITQSLSE